MKHYVTLNLSYRDHITIALAFVSQKLSEPRNISKPQLYMKKVNNLKVPLMFLSFAGLKISIVFSTETRFKKHAAQSWLSCYAKKTTQLCNAQGSGMNNLFKFCKKVIMLLKLKL